MSARGTRLLAEKLFSWPLVVGKAEPMLDLPRSFTRSQFQILDSAAHPSFIHRWSDESGKFFQFRQKAARTTQKLQHLAR